MSRPDDDEPSRQLDPVRDAATVNIREPAAELHLLIASAPSTRVTVRGVISWPHTCYMATNGNDDDTLSRFVLRARRIAAHSLVQDRAELSRHAEGSFSGTLDTSGNMSVIQELPDSEEAFESLAARLRPLTVAREPIYYAKVLSALEPFASDSDQVRIKALRRAWTAAEIQGSQVQAFAVQQSRLDGSEATDFVSDTQLAAGWLYADLVHADAVGPKKAALISPSPSVMLTILSGKAVSSDRPSAMWQAVELECLDDLGLLSEIAGPDSRTALVQARTRLGLSLLKWWSAMHRSWTHGLVGTKWISAGTALSPSHARQLAQPLLLLAKEM